MSYQSNHEPETVGLVNFDSDPRSCPQACDCTEHGNGVGEMCGACQAEYLAYRERQDAEEAGVLEILPERAPVAVPVLPMLPRRKRLPF